MATTFLGVLFSVAGLGLIAIQMCLSIGWIKRSVQKPLVRLEHLPLPDALIKLAEKVLNSAGWMGITSLILIYISSAFLNVSVIGS